MSNTNELLAIAIEAEQMNKISVDEYVTFVRVLAVVIDQMEQDQRTVDAYADSEEYR